MCLSVYSEEDFDLLNKIRTKGYQDSEVQEEEAVQKKEITW
jgi:hypothetical protein